MNHLPHCSASRMTLLLSTLTVGAIAAALSVGVSEPLQAQAQPKQGNRQDNANYTLPTGQQTQEGENLRYSLAYPTGDRESSALLLEKVSPARVKVGQPFSYTIRVTNLTKEPLANVSVVESVASGIQLESSNPPYAQVRTSAASRSRNQQQQRGAGQADQQDQPSQKGNAASDVVTDQAQPAADKKQGNQKNQQKKPANKSSNKADATDANASADQGQKKAAQPKDQARNAEARKADDDAADSASARQPGAKPGQQARQGNQQNQRQANQQSSSQARQTVRWDVAELMAGQTHTITVRAVAQGKGQIASCMTATYQPTLCTVVEAVAPELTLRKELVGAKQPSPETDLSADARYVYLCDTFTYRYTVGNTGTAVSKNVVIRDPLAEGLTTVDGEDTVLIQAGDLQPGQSRSFTQEVKASQTGTFTSRATAKSADDEATSQRVTTSVREADLAVQVAGPEWTYSGEPVTFQVHVRNDGEVPARGVKLALQSPGWPEQPKERDLGNIQPGQSVPISVTVEPRADREKIQLNATATSVCAMGENAAKGVASAEIRRTPALLIEMVDDTDPLRIGGQTTYTINVKNQGTAPAKNVQLTGELTEQLQFVSGQGQTNVSGEAQNVKFGAVQSLKPGDVVTWKVQAKAVKAGDGRLRVDMSADNVSQKGLEIEPTTAQEAAPTKIGGGGGNKN